MGQNSPGSCVGDRASGTSGVFLLSTYELLVITVANEHSHSTRCPTLLSYHTQGNGNPSKTECLVFTVQHLKPCRLNYLTKFFVGDEYINANLE